jgi:hypothetical protein
MLRARRVPALLLTLVFLFAGTAEGMGVHRCPHHDVLPGTAQAAAVHGADDHGAGHHAHTADASAPAHENCTCMGACQAGSAATPPDGGSAVIALDSGTDRHVVWWSPPSARATLVPFLLPFANGPPSR